MLRCKLWRYGEPHMILRSRCQELNWSACHGDGCYCAEIGRPCAAGTKGTVAATRSISPQPQRGCLAGGHNGARRSTKSALTQIQCVRMASARCSDFPSSLATWRWSGASWMGAISAFTASVSWMNTRRQKGDALESGATVCLKRGNGHGERE